MKISDLPNIISRLFFVPKCAVCNTRLPLSHPDGVLCPICRLRYENEKTVTCPVCASVLGECLCLPPDMPKSAAHKMVKLVSYHPGAEDASADMIFALKHHATTDLLRFFADELALRLLPVVNGKEHFVVTYPPRGRKALRHDGYDHAASLASALGRRLHLPALSLFRRRYAGQQKKLSRTARLAAARAGYTLRRNASVKGKRVILVDDICTTGATLTALAKHLRASGAREIVFAVIAVTSARA
ncbi:MAG: ComF family protein [Clostridia bacterium]|nr:ComF family protein [Clostridia bacterium]